MEYNARPRQQAFGATSTTVYQEVYFTGVLVNTDRGIVEVVRISPGF